MESKIVKPATMIKEEFKQDVINLINSSQLPLFITEYILKDVLNEVHMACERQEQEDKRRYESLLEEQRKTESDD